ncbi:MAG: elongation factor 1-beta family protein [Candidatus Micrarchaeota archaeon]|nr:elongation factor 1-beta family protein [Candidatus Micrarchaeota archaeon]MCX8154315.1 elongation factor 1-beta family protein [Candidatus Micrarchaeota archaeon]
MAKMSVVYQINVDQEYIDSLRERLVDEFDAKDIKIVDIGFGIRALQVLFILDESYSTDDLEYRLSELEGVSSVNMISMNRLG